MFPFYDPINIRVKNEGEAPIKMGFSTIFPGETVDVSATHLTAPVISRAQRQGATYVCLVIGGKCFELSEIPKDTQEREPSRVPAETEPEIIVSEKKTEMRGNPDAVMLDEPPEAEEPDLFGEPSLDDMKVAELIDVAKEKGVSYTGLKKAELLEELKKVE